MSRGKTVKKLLLDASKSALFAGIEIHNKPHIAYRYPTAVILIVNAWELVMKAYVYKFIGKNYIYENDKKHTITFLKALTLTRDHINYKNKNNRYKAAFENLNLLNYYRCANIHFIERTLDPVIFMLISKAVLNYDQFLEDFFQKDITKDDNLIILPVGFKLPFDPIEYLKQDYGKAHNDFSNHVVQTIRELNAKNVQDSIVIGFDVYTASVKKVTNADIVAAIDQAHGDVVLTKRIQITDDPNAPAVRAEDLLLPLTYQDVREKVKKRRPDIKFNDIFNRSMKKVKSNPVLCQTRYLDPKKKSGTKKDFYAEKTIDHVIELYDEMI